MATKNKTTKTTRAAAKPRTKATKKPGAKATKKTTAKATKKPAAKSGKTSRAGDARKAKTAPKGSRKAKRQAEPGSEAESMPRFAVAFIDSFGQEHVATALAPDPGVALSGLLEQAEKFEEPWLEDLVAVVVSHPSTWQSVRGRVLDVFEP